MPEKLLVNPIDWPKAAALRRTATEAIALDEWGYPIVDPRPSRPASTHARAAVSACPTCSPPRAPKPASRELKNRPLQNGAGWRARAARTRFRVLGLRSASRERSGIPVSFSG